MTVYRLPGHISLDKASPIPLPHTLPVPPALLIRACDEVEYKVGHLPFHWKGIEVGRSLIGTALEELNAEPTRALALREYTADGGRVRVDGLHVHLALRGIEGEGAAAAIAEVLIQAGIAQKVSNPDRRSRRVVQGVRLLPSWTWHIASDPKDPIPLTGTTAHVPEDLRSWKNLCPVCRAGTLKAVTGQRLFGIMPTDFIACIHCGAKFVPDNDDYRLVSIAIKSDPVWGRYLNKTMSTDAWEAIALQSGSLAKGQQVRTRGDHRQKTTTHANKKISQTHRRDWRYRLVPGHTTSPHSPCTISGGASKTYTHRTRYHYRRSSACPVTGPLRRPYTISIPTTSGPPWGSSFSS